jgi:hypothetical protein
MHVGSFTAVDGCGHEKPPLAFGAAALGRSHASGHQRSVDEPPAALPFRAPTRYHNFTKDSL